MISLLIQISIPAIRIRSVQNDKLMKNVWNSTSSSWSAERRQFDTSFFWILTLIYNFIRWFYAQLVKLFTNRFNWNHFSTFFGDFPAPKYSYIPNTTKTNHKSARMPFETSVCLTSGVKLANVDYPSYKIHKLISMPRLGWWHCTIAIFPHVVNTIFNEIWHSILLSHCF